MNVIDTEIEGVKIIEPRIFGDARGYFFESFSMRDFAAQTGIEVTFVQDNESKSRYGVIRGLHFQKPPYAQSKLVRVVSGTVLDVAVDIRKGSPTYGRHVAVELSGENHRQFFLPKGMAHGFAVLSDEVVFQTNATNTTTPSRKVPSPGTTPRWPSTGDCRKATCCCRRKTATTRSLTNL